MKLKALLITIVCVVMAIGMTACGGSSSSGGGSTAEGGDQMTIRIASDETMETPCSKATEVFQEKVEELSNGTMKVEYYSDSAMGDEREIAESVNMGNLEMGIISAAYMATYDPNWYSVDLPFVFEDRDSMYSLLDGELGDYLKKTLEEKSSIKCFDFADGSFKILLNTKKEVKNVDDTHGLKFRSMDSQMNMAIYKAWGSSAVPMGMSEVYTAMQQGTVDGVDTSPLYQVTQKFQELGKYYTMTNHQALLMISIANKDWFNSLTEEQQNVIVEASKAAYQESERSIVVEDEEACIKVLDDAGLKRTELDEAGLKSFKDKAQEVYDIYAKEVDPEVYELLGIK